MQSTVRVFRNRRARILTSRSLRNNNFRSIPSCSVERFREINSPPLVVHKKQGAGREGKKGGRLNEDRYEVKRTRKKRGSVVIEGDLLSYEFDSRYYVSLVTGQ